MTGVLALLLFIGTLCRIGGQGLVGGDGAESCCKFITVNVDNDDLNGNYVYKEKKDEKPETVCINGCVYTKEGEIAGDEFCFVKDEDLTADAACPVSLIV